jgi:uncharacterized lipoprotein YbaY
VRSFEGSASHPPLRPNEQLALLAEKFGRAVLLLACLWCWEAPATGHVKGAATYRGPTALLFESLLEDVSKVEALVEVVGRFRMERPGNLPIQFEITNDPANISPNHRYAVWARILVGGKVFFTTERPHWVLAGRHGNEVKLDLRQSPSVPAEARTDLLGGLRPSWATCPALTAQAFVTSWSCFQTVPSSCERPTVPG